MFDDKIKRIYSATGVSSDSELAEILEIKPPSVAGARKRRIVPGVWIEKIAKNYTVSADWLLFGRGPMRPGEAAPEPFVGANTCGNDEDLVMIPRVSARLAAGTGSLETDGDILGMYAFRADWILRKGNTKKMVLMDVVGDSMQPEIRHGDMALIDQGKTDILANGYFAVGVDDAVFLKQLRIRPGMLVLHSLNPDYEDITVNMHADQPDAVRIIGRVIWIGRELA